MLAIAKATGALEPAMVEAMTNCGVGIKVQRMLGQGRR